MGEQVLAAVRTGPGRTELRGYPMPEVRPDGALPRAEGVIHVSLMPWL